MSFPNSRPSRLASHFDGLKREEAVEAATRELEVLRPETDKAILSLIGRLDKIAIGATESTAAASMKEMLALCDQLITLAGTFGHGALSGAACSLCDLLDGLLEQGRSDSDSIRVHLETIHLFAPGSPPLGEGQTGVMLSGLHKLLDLHGFARAD